MQVQKKTRQKNKQTTIVAPFHHFLKMFLCVESASDRHKRSRPPRPDVMFPCVHWAPSPWRYLHVGTGGFLCLLRSLVVRFQLLSLVSQHQKQRIAGGTRKQADFCQSLARKTDVSVDFDSGFDSVRYSFCRWGTRKEGGWQVNCAGS